MNKQVQYAAAQARQRKLAEEGQTRTNVTPLQVPTSPHKVKYDVRTEVGLGETPDGTPAYVRKTTLPLDMPGDHLEYQRLRDQVAISDQTDHPHLARIIHYDSERTAKGDEHSLYYAVAPGDNFKYYPDNPNDANRVLRKAVPGGGNVLGGGDPTVYN